MTDDQSFVPQPRRARDIVRDGIVMVSMTFVGLAVGFGLHLQMGFAFWPAAATAAAVYLSMLFSHLMLSQNRETAMLRQELVRLNVEITQLRRTPAEGGVLREAPVAAAEKRPAAWSTSDDAADLLSDLSGRQQSAPASVPVRPRQAPIPAQVLFEASPPRDKLAVPVSTKRAEPAVAERDHALPELKSVAAKRAESTEGDRDVEAIHDLIKKLAADIVGGPAAVAMPARRTAAQPETPARPMQPEAISEMPAKQVDKAIETLTQVNVPKPEPARPTMPATIVQPAPPKQQAVGRVPLAAIAIPMTVRAAVKPLPAAPDVVQTLADQLDTLPPVRGADRVVAAAGVSPGAAAAVAAARTAVEARLAAKAVAAPVVAASVPVIASPSAESQSAPELAHHVNHHGRADGAELAQIGAQLSADLGAETRLQGPADFDDLADDPVVDTSPTLELNVQALKSAVDAMRAQPTVAALAAAMHEPTDELASAPIDPQLRDNVALISSALDEERFEVCLEAIIGLEDRRAQHYEVTIRLKDVDDGFLSTVGGTGLLPLLDASIIDQSARIAWKLEDRGRPGSLFSQITGESLESDRFLNRFADTYRRSETVASRLVLAFVQNDLRQFTAAHWATLRDMADLGFRFSLEDVTDLDLDFQGLQEAGFAFVKLDAAVFLDGLPIATGKVPSSHVCRFFEEVGLVVIVGHIAEEEQYEQLMEAGVGFGQGLLFGEARPVKADVLKSPQRAVA